MFGWGGGCEGLSLPGTAVLVSFAVAAFRRLPASAAAAAGGGGGGDGGDDDGDASQKADALSALSKVATEAALSAPPSLVLLSRRGGSTGDSTSGSNSGGGNSGGKGSGGGDGSGSRGNSGSGGGGGGGGSAAQLGARLMLPQLRELAAVHPWPRRKIARAAARRLAALPPGSPLAVDLAVLVSHVLQPGGDGGLGEAEGGGKLDGMLRELLFGRRFSEDNPKVGAREEGLRMLEISLSTVVNRLLVDDKSCRLWCVVLGRAVSHTDATTRQAVCARTVSYQCNTPARQSEESTCPERSAISSSPAEREKKPEPRYGSKTAYIPGMYVPGIFLYFYYRVWL